MMGYRRAAGLRRVRSKRLSGSLCNRDDARPPRGAVMAADLNFAAAHMSVEAPLHRQVQGISGDGRGGNWMTSVFEEFDTQRCINL
jgi:hypothetical protein